MNCPFSRKVWFGSNINIKFPESPEFEFQDWLRQFIQTTDAATIIYAASVIYNLWYARNKLIFEDYKTNIEDILNYINKTIHEYQICNKINNIPNMMHKLTSTHNQQTQHTVPTRWRKP